MMKFLLAGAAVVFAGIGTAAVAADHKAKPMHAAVLTAEKSTTAHKESAPRKHRAGKRHHHAHKSHAK
jgi:hypothetical protein